MEIGVSDDYAVLETKKYLFYFGYEHEVDEEWCFVCTDKTTKEELAVMKQSDIDKGTDDRIDGCSEYLLAGIALMLDKLNYDLEPPH